MRFRWPLADRARGPGGATQGEAHEDAMEDAHEALRLEFLLTSWRRTAEPTLEEAVQVRAVLAGRLADGTPRLARGDGPDVADGLASGRPAGPLLRRLGAGLGYPRDDAGMSLVWLAAGEGDAMAHLWLAAALARRPAAELPALAPLLAEHLEAAGLARLAFDEPGLRSLAAGLLLGPVPEGARAAVPDHAGAVAAHLEALSALRMEPGWRDRLAAAGSRAAAAVDAPPPPDDLDFLCEAGPAPPPQTPPPAPAGRDAMDVAPGFTAAAPHLRAYAALERPLPLVHARDPADLESRLLDRLPWMEGPVRHVARSQRLRARGATPWFGFAPILLVGGTGIGKSRFPRVVSEESGVPFKPLNASGQSGAIEFLGHSPTYRESHPSAPVEAMVGLRAANPILFIDEIDKVGSSDWNGSAHAALLPILEPETARRFNDEFLRHGVDISQISYVLTANSLTGLPRELLDRVEVFRVEAPTPDQLEGILHGLVSETASEFGLSTDEAPPLEPEFLRGLGRMFEAGASIRRVRRAIRGAMLSSASHAPH